MAVRAEAPETPDLLRAERDLYRSLLELASEDDVEVFLRHALTLLLRVVDARCGYVELRDEADEANPAFWAAEGFSAEELVEVRSALSSGVIAHAIATGMTIASASAVDDARFSDLASVRRNRIQAVLCSPIGRENRMGVVYLQDRSEPGPFSDTDRERTDLVAQRIAPLAERLLIVRRARSPDPTQRYRETLDLSEIVGRSAALAGVFREIAAVAPRKVTVLLTGPSGTGKTQLARSLHTNSPRRRAPFVELNCATLPEALVESELFGAMPGAHSTANRRIHGKVAAAEGGTLFLDEIAELPLGAQSKLLQLLQSFEYFPLGASSPVAADVRIVAATNVDLKVAVENGKFREDLYYRLHIVPIQVPALATRTEDVHDLLLAFAARACKTNDLPLIGFSPSAVRAAETADWPGNIRQLENAVEAATIRAAAVAAPQIEIEHLFPEPRGTESAPPALTFQAATRRFQADLVRRVLEETEWNVVETARRLELTRSHVYNLIRAHGLDRGALK